MWRRARLIDEPTLIDDRYEIEGRLGVGGMGAVYRARDRLMQEANDPDPYIALKLILDSVQDPQAAIALQREARRAQTLNHVNIVRVFYFGRDKDGRYYLTMELLRGKSLEQKLRDESAPMSLAAAMPLIEKVCSALTYAHAQGIVHSDIKPSNVFITESGEPKLLDFGIASPMRSASGRETQFNPRSLGALSPNYASIEQFLGMDADPRDDVYSVACLTYELLSGQRPYGGQVAPRALEHGLTTKPIRSLSRARERSPGQGAEPASQGSHRNRRGLRCCAQGIRCTRCDAASAHLDCSACLRGADRSSRHSDLRPRPAGARGKGRSCSDRRKAFKRAGAIRRRREHERGLGRTGVIAGRTGGRIGADPDSQPHPCCFRSRHHDAGIHGRRATSGHHRSGQIRGSRAIESRR